MDAERKSTRSFKWSLICFSLGAGCIPLSFLTLSLLDLTGGDLDTLGEAIGILLLFAAFSAVCALASLLLGIRALKQRKVVLLWIIPSALWILLVLSAWYDILVP
jgi:hypothetical protein